MSLNGIGAPKSGFAPVSIHVDLIDLLGLAHPDGLEDDLDDRLLGADLHGLVGRVVHHDAPEPNVVALNDSGEPVEAFEAHAAAVPEERSPTKVVGATKTGLDQRGLTGLDNLVMTRVDVEPNGSWFASIWHTSVLVVQHELRLWLGVNDRA